MFWNQFPYTDFHELNLDWVIKKLRALGIHVDELEEHLTQFEGDIQGQIDYLTNWVNNYDDSFARSVIQKYLATMIFVEIDDTGYIVYNIPDSWESIDFNTTGLDITVPGVEYGSLVLSY